MANTLITHSMSHEAFYGVRLFAKSRGSMIYCIFIGSFYNYNEVT